MKNFLKAALIVLLLVVVISSFATSSKSGGSNVTITSTIQEFENDIEQGKIIKDGVLNQTSSEEVSVASNTLASLFNTIGSLIVEGISKLLKLIAQLITKFIG